MLIKNMFHLTKTMCSFKQSTISILDGKLIRANYKNITSTMDHTVLQKKLIFWPKFQIKQRLKKELMLKYLDKALTLKLLGLKQRNINKNTQLLTRFQTMSSLPILIGEMFKATTSPTLIEIKAIVAHVTQFHSLKLLSPV